MNKLNYKDMQLISLNMAGYNWRASTERWLRRFPRACAYIRGKMNSPFLIALQEVQLAGGKYLSVLETQFPDYYIVLPKGYNNQPKSVISILLINKTLCKSYTVETLESLEDSLRYNFVTINTYIKGLCFRILNINVPHSCFNENTAGWYREERKELRALYISRITELANLYRNESDVKLILMGDFNALPDSEFIDSLAYMYNNKSMVDAVKPCFKNTYTWKNYKTNTKNRLDYILYSTGMLCNTGVSAKVTITDDTSILNKLSDHCIVIGGIELKIDNGSLVP